MGNEFMAMLAENYQAGILIVSAVIWVLYILLTVLSTIIRYKRVGKLSALGTVPIVHIFLLFMGKPPKADKPKAEPEDTFDDIF